MKEKRTLQNVAYILFFLAAIIILFHWYTTRNRERMEERNKNYAADSAQLKAAQIDEELTNALNRINTYSFFVGEGLSEPEIIVQMLTKIEQNSMFDAILFMDTNGIDHASDGRTADIAGSNLYTDGLRGESNITIVFDHHFFDETMACFYAPVRFQDEIIGVLRGAFLAEAYLKDMLATTYFGQAADVFLCTPDGRIIASSDDERHNGNLMEMLTESGMIDEITADSVEEVFKNGGKGAFVCAPGCKTDNICVTYLPENDFVLVQTFPKSVTQSMTEAENLVGIQLESALMVLFAIYIVSLVVRARREKKRLELENRERGWKIPLRDKPHFR